MGKSRILKMLLERDERFLFISCDSRKIYRGMDIGTNKPPKELRYFFRLIDIRSPAESYSAQDFAEDAMREVRYALERGKFPIVVAGTPLYYRALFFGLFEAPPVDPRIRMKLLKRLKEVGSVVLYKELSRVDPETAAALHPNDWIRITRALEVYYQTGEPISKLRKENSPSGLPKPISYGVRRERQELYRKINIRVDRMINRGFLDEVKNLYESGYDFNAPGMRTIGYSELLRHILGMMSFKEAVRLIKKRTRIYARKQMYFFRQLGPIRWFPFYRFPLNELISKSREIYR